MERLIYISWPVGDLTIRKCENKGEASPGKLFHPAPLLLLLPVTSVLVCTKCILWVVLNEVVVVEEEEEEEV